ncbi:vacuolar fusion protein CCZ1 isoform X1 [Rhodnius prolixus]
MTSHTADITLKNFFVYNVTFGQNEGQEEEKIMYFYPRETVIDVKMKEVGLSEAIIKFTETFSTDLCEALQTKKTRKLFLQPEPNFWIVMTITVPTGWDALEGTEYRGNEVQLPIYEAVLRQAYLTSKLFIGPYQTAIEKHGPDFLKMKLDMFFTRYLLSVRLKENDIIGLFQGVRFLPLDKPTFLHSQCFINSVEAKFPIVDYVMLFFNDELIWSGVGAEDAQIIYRYLISSLLPTYLKATKSISALSLSRPLPAVNRFVTGPDTLNDKVYTDQVPKVYISSVMTPGHYHLVVYRLQQLTIALLIPSDQILKLEFYRNLDSFLAPRMEKISKEIHSYRDLQHQISSSNCSSDESMDTRYVYFNSLNLATKSTLNEKKFPAQGPIAKDLLNILVTMHQNQKRLVEEGITSGEHIVKTKTDHWVVGRMSNNRHFYITLERKKTNLVEVSEEVKKICEKQLKSIFFHL